MADPNNAVIYDRRLVCMFICKAGNTSIKRALADALDLPTADHAPEPLRPHRRFDLHCPTPNKMDAYALREQGFTVFAVVRNPLARLASCYVDKVRGRLHGPFRRKYGDEVRKGMSFDEWVRFVARTPDGKSDQHFRSMAWDLLTEADEVIPENVFRVEDRDWWRGLRSLLRDRCGVDIGPERRENASGLADWASFYGAETRGLAEDRYAADFKAFGYG